MRNVLILCTVLLVATLALGDVVATQEDLERLTAMEDCTVFHSLSENANHKQTELSRAISEKQDDALRLKTAWEACATRTSKNLDIAAAACAQEYRAWVLPSFKLSAIRQELREVQSDLLQLKEILHRRCSSFGSLANN